MNKKERIQELKRLFTTPENKLRPSEFKTWEDLHKRIDELVGRSTFAHEFAFPEMLYEEIRSGEKGSAFGKSLVEAAKLTKSGKAFIVVPETVEGMNLGFKVVGKVEAKKD